MQTTRPVRGAVRLDGLRWDVGALRRDLARFEDRPWKFLNYGSAWSMVQPLRPKAGGGLDRDPRLDECPEFQRVMDAFPGKTMDFSLARLDPGGSVKDHRDISGGTPMGVARFHVPIVTHEDVRFFLHGQVVRMRPGETWNLDTTYLHRVENASQVSRVHLILDVELNDAVRAMLPAVDLRDRVHDVAFAAICAAHAVKLGLKDPRALAQRATRYARLRWKRESVLIFDEDQPAGDGAAQR